MEAWPINILAFSPTPSQEQATHKVLPQELGFGVDMAPSDRFMGRSLNCHCYDVIVMVEPKRLDDVLYAWRLSRQSRLNQQTPLVVMGSPPSSSLAAIIERMPSLTHITLPAPRKVICRQVISIAYGRALHRALTRPRNETSLMPTTLAALLPYPQQRGMVTPGSMAAAPA
ncbi:MAG: hypothetical protein KI792_13880 [Alphaproteobacteria bacterium]|nr:hypothetical protein [Alphaproteobacteria bacterium SS10]